MAVVQQAEISLLYIVNEVRYGKGETRNRRGPLIAAGILLGFL